MQEPCQGAWCSLNAAQSVIVTESQLLHISLTYSTLISSALGRQKSEHFFLRPALQPATGRIASLFQWGSSHICTFLANLPKGIRVTRHTLEYRYVWNFIKCPTKWDYLCLVALNFKIFQSDQNKNYLNSVLHNELFRVYVF